MNKSSSTATSNKNNNNADVGSLANPDGEWAEEDLKHMREEWYYLYEQFQSFKKQNPEKHVLFAKAVSALRKDESLAHHRAVYETLCNMLKLIEIAKETERAQAKSQGMQCEPEDAPPQMREMVQREVIALQIGYTLGAMLKKWPKGGVPNVKNTPANRAAAAQSTATADRQSEKVVGGKDPYEYNSDDDAPE